MKSYLPNGQKVADISSEPDYLTESIINQDLYVVNLLQPYKQGCGEEGRVAHRQGGHVRCDGEPTELRVP